MKHNFKVREERHSICGGIVWAGTNPTSSSVNVSSGLMADSKSRHCWQMKREPYSGNDKCGNTENLKVMCRPTASRTGNTPPQTQAQQWTQMLMTQGLILVKHKSSNLVGSPSSFLDFLWNCGHHATSAQPSIESVPPIPAEGGSVRLLIHHLPENLQGFAWFKGMSVFRDH